MNDILYAVLEDKALIFIFMVSNINSNTKY
jgi:hypothetical protein